MRPQPQPTSSSRSPAFRPSLRQTRSNFSYWASSSVASAVREDRARVGHRGPEDDLVEAVRDVVVVRDRGRVALLRVAQPAAPRRRCLLGRRRGAAQRPRAQGAQDLDPLAPRDRLDVRDERVDRGVDVAVDLERAGDVGADEPELSGGRRDVGDRLAAAGSRAASRRPWGRSSSRRRRESPPGPARRRFARRSPQASPRHLRFTHFSYRSSRRRSGSYACFSSSYFSPPYSSRNSSRS